MPVYYDFQTYPWIDPGASNSTARNGIQDQGRLNYLLYLGMTGPGPAGAPMINRDGRYLPVEGNWTNGRDPSGAGRRCEYGSFVLSRKKFVDAFLLPKFDKINRMVNVKLRDLKADIEAHGVMFNYSRSITVATGEGVTSLEPEIGDHPFRFKDPGHEDHPFPNVSMEHEFGKLPSNHLQWHWSFQNQSLKEHNSDRGWNFLYKVEHWGRAESETDSRWPFRERD